jgi:dihydrofolate synthase/folylpolyglutamate synthase
MVLALFKFLELKPLYYKEINYERIFEAYDVLKKHIKKPTTLHVVGTNGKGSTGRMVAHLAYMSGLNVGHFSSPHILKFNERIWLNGSDSTNAILEESHQKLFLILGEEVSDALSYFEYTTLLVFLVFENCDLMVIEAGLGGEFDATNVHDKALSIITPIGIDHQAFLGNTIEEIASTKIRSIQKKVLLAPQVYSEVLDVARKIAKQKDAKLFFSSKVNHLASIAEEKAWGEYLVENAEVAIKALEILGMKYNVNDLKSLKLFGRFYALENNIRIDVGHNPLAASAIVKALKQKVVLVYNSLDDKAYEEVLSILKPKVKRVEIIIIETQRATVLAEIEKALKNVDLDYSYFKNEMKKDENYLVFGSFYAVEAFLKRINY